MNPVPSILYGWKESAIVHTREQVAKESPEAWKYWLRWAKIKLHQGVLHYCWENAYITNPCCCWPLPHCKPKSCRLVTILWSPNIQERQKPCNVSGKATEVQDGRCSSHILFQILKTMTTAYHPASNGKVEQFNYTFLQMIRCYVDQNQKNCDKQLPLLTAAYWSAQHSSTSFTLNMLMLGKEVH